MSAPFEARVQRRWADLDAQGHVNNTQILDYVREAWAQLAGARPLTAPLVETARLDLAHVQYRRPVLFAPGPLRVSLGLGEAGPGRLVLESVVWEGEVPAARARLGLSLARLTPSQSTVLGNYQTGDVGGVLAELAVSGLDGRGLPYDLAPRLGDANPRGEIDPLSLYTYVQEARVAIMGQIDPAMARLGTTTWDPMADQAPALWLIAQQDVHYLAPVPYRTEPYRMRTAVVRLGTSSITLQAELIDPASPEDILMRAATVSVYADATGQPRPLPDRLRAALEQTMAEVG